MREVSSYDGQNVVSMAMKLSKSDVDIRLGAGRQRIKGRYSE